MRPETLAVHAGAEVDPATQAVAPPLHLSTTFVHGPAGERGPAGYEYTRGANPNERALEQALAALEGGAGALVYGSGMAATHAFLSSFPPGSHVLVPHDVYHGTRTLGRELLPALGITLEAVDTDRIDAIAAALRPQTRAIWLETPSNPQLRIADIAATAALARAHGLLLAVDSTFATPALQRPLALGADVVMHSTTKYLGGHSDVMGGALVYAREDAHSARWRERRALHGAVLAPFNAWLTLRGLRSLHARMRMHATNARAVATFLAAHPRVERVCWPGLASHPNHEVAARQMSDFGGMVSVRVDGGRDAALRVAGRLRLFTNATSLGGVESLVEHRASVEGAEPVSPQNLLRLSVGLEHPDDLVEDLAQALSG